MFGRDWDKSIIQTHTTLPLNVVYGCATNKNFRRGKIKYQEPLSGSFQQSTPVDNSSTC